MSYSFQKNNSNAAVTVGELNQVVNGLELPYRVYTALLTQSEENPPVATVLDNTIGDIVWSYSSVGEYTGTLIGAFTLNKTAGFLGSDFANLNSGGRLSNTNGDIDTVNVQTFNLSTVSQSDDILLNTFIEIRVYN